MDYLGWLLLGIILGAAGVTVATRFLRKRFLLSLASPNHTIAADLVRAHFRPISTDDLTISEREFPFRVRADLQLAIDRLFGDETKTVHFCGVRKEYSHEGVTMTDCIVPGGHYPAVSIPPEYEEVDVGDETPVRVLKVGLWLLENHGIRFTVLLAPTGQFGRITAMQFQIATPNTPEGTRIRQDFFKHLEEAIQQAESYRGKVLSLEALAHDYSGQSAGITVHKLRHVEREQVILPQSTLELLERNVIQFIAQRERLARFQQATKKGLLFYGPPGTGKTHTIHYLARALEGHTTLLISAEQVGLLAEYMTLARLLQPSMVVIEDVDLIARDRADMDNVCSEVLLNKLLNEMDGLKAEADILFVLTTNRPESLEAALASRPGRVDQAIEFPLPDEAGREKLARLYSKGVQLEGGVLADVVRRTAGVSAAFIKELMRRSVQFHIERDGNGQLSSHDVLEALDEMLVSGGTLNLALLGGAGVETQC